MKKLLLLHVFLFSIYVLNGQTPPPEGINYQAVARTSSGNVLASTALSVKFIIHDNTAGGPVTFTETQAVTTNAYGLFTAVIGSAASSASTFPAINWGSGAKFLEIQIDDTGSGTYTTMGTTQMMSVPYALYAKYSNISGNGPSGATGSTGNDGATGPTGLTGATGTGSTGPTGAASTAVGPTGADGATGPTGAGTTGATGNDGPTGTAGTNGTNGATGPTGAAGTNGTNGTNGVDGATGPTGTAGTNGTNGTNGATGAVGTTGATGVTGSTGDRYSTSTPAGTTLNLALGSQSFSVGLGLAYSIGQTVIIAADPAHEMVGNITAYNPGTGAMTVTITSIVAGSGSFTATWSVNLNGAPGPAGATGPTGTAGTNGTNGSNGATGPTGTAGTNGTNGAAGATGPTGTNGTNGTNGAAGATGATGTAGTNGTNGAAGATGVTGATGTAGTNGTNGAAGATGATGTAGTNGTNGAAGATGVTGATGTAGTNGTNGAAGATGVTGTTGPTWTLSSIVYNPVGTITVNGTAGSGGPITSPTGSWLSAGNTGTAAASNFLGTTDAVDLVIRTNSVEKMRVQSGGNVGIGTALPNATALVDITSTAKGLLVPRMTAAQKLAIAGGAPANGLLIFQTDGLTGFWYYDGASTQWVRISNGLGPAWTVGGNTGTTFGTNFIGTTDAQGLQFRTNNIDRMDIEPTGDVGIGTNAPGIIAGGVSKYLTISSGPGAPSTTDAASLELNGGSSTPSATQAKVDFIARATDGNNYNTGRIEMTNTPGSTLMGRLHFYTRNASLTDRMIIDENGVVTITNLAGPGGTVVASPTGVLSIAGGSTVTGTGTANYLPKWNVGGTSLTPTSDIYDAAPGVSIGMGATPPNCLFQVAGLIDFENNGSNVSLGQGTGTGTSPAGFYYNTMVGANAGQASTGTPASANSNTFFGYYAGAATTSGGNTFVGTNSGSGNTTGGSNTFMGVAAGIGNTTGTSNTFMGSSSGSNVTTGSNNTFIGNGAGLSSATQHNNSSAIGTGAKVNVDNAIILGNPAAIVGIGTASPSGAQFDVEGPATSGSISAGIFNVNYGSNTAPALSAATAGSGSAINASSNGNTTTHNATVYGEQDGLGGSGGSFVLTDNANADPALFASSNNASGTSAKFDGSKASFIFSGGTPKVGIGTAAPASILHVLSTAGGGSFILHEDVSTSNPFGIQFKDPSQQWYFMQNNGSAATGSLSFYDGTATQTRMIILPTTGFIGVGLLNPLYRFHVVDATVAGYTTWSENTYVGSADGHGVYGKSVNNPFYGIGVTGEGGYMGVQGIGTGTTNASTTYGVYGSSTGTTAVGTRMGVFGTASGAATNYGVYASVAVGGSNYAVYSNGAQFSTTGSAWTVSDRKLKKNIEDLDINALETIAKIKVKQYYFDTEKYKTLNLPTEQQWGFIAQDMEEIIPGMVKNHIHPAQYDPTSKQKISDEIEIKAIQYDKLFPLLVKANQEQQAQIEMFKKQLQDQADAMKTLMDRLDQLEKK